MTGAVDPLDLDDSTRIREIGQVFALAALRLATTPQSSTTDGRNRLDADAKAERACAAVKHQQHRDAGAA